MTAARKKRLYTYVTGRLAYINNLLAVPGTLVVSRRGVPHLVLPRCGTTYSVAYFASKKFWRVFYPYQTDRPTTKDFKHPHELATWLNDLYL